jgi:hypothetical protein
VSPAGLGVALTFFSPVFLPAVVGLVLCGVAGRAVWLGVHAGVRTVVASTLVIPGFALAVYLANYNLTHDTTDVPPFVLACGVAYVLGVSTPGHP